MKGVFSAFKPWRTTALFCWEGRPIFAARLCRSPIRTTNLRSRKPRQGPRYLLPTDAHFERLIVGDFLFGLVNISSMFFNPFQSLHIHMKANSHNLFRLTTSHVSKRINFSGKKKGKTRPKIHFKQATDPQTDRVSSLRPAARTRPSKTARANKPVPPPSASSKPRSHSPAVPTPNSNHVVFASAPVQNSERWSAR